MIPGSGSVTMVSVSMIVTGVMTLWTVMMAVMRMAVVSSQRDELW